jgi:hypothetical protein
VQEERFFEVGIFSASYSLLCTLSTCNFFLCNILGTSAGKIVLLLQVLKEGANCPNLNS